MENNYLSHHGILGQKWGIRRYQNEDGSLTPEGRERYGVSSAGRSVFVSGSSKTQDPNSGYYRKELPKEVSSSLDSYMNRNYKINVGDAPGIDRQVQDYLNTKGYKNVEIYGPGKQVRYTANKKWKTNPIDAPEFEEYSSEWLAKKDIAMGKNSDEGMAVILDDGANATRRNINRLIDEHKDVKVFQLNAKDTDAWVTEEYLENLLKSMKHSEGGLDMTYDELVHTLFSEEPPEDDHLEHHGILGQKWGKKNGPPYPLDENDHSAAEKKLNKFTPSGVVAKYKDHKKKVQRQKALKKARATKAANAEAKKAAEEHEAAKQKALRSANAAEIMKYRDELTDNEMKDAVARIGWDETLRKKAKEQNPGKIEKAVKIVDKYGTMAGKVGDATAGFTKMYNNIAKVLNTFTDSDWPTIGDSKNGNQNDSDKKPESSKPSENKNNKNNRDKKNFDKVIREATRILGNAAKKVDEEESQKEAKSGAKGFKGEKWEKHDWTVDDKQSSGSSSNSSSSRKETFVDTKFEDVTPAQAEEVGRLAVERYLQLEDKRKG